MDEELIQSEQQQQEEDQVYDDDKNVVTVDDAEDNEIVAIITDVVVPSRNNINEPTDIVVDGINSNDNDDMTTQAGILQEINIHEVKDEEIKISISEESTQSIISPAIILSVPQVLVPVESNRAALLSSTSTSTTAAVGVGTTSTNNMSKINSKLLQEENDTLKEKISKLKTLLGRSAKVQRETKIELDIALKKINELTIYNTKLQNKLDKLSNRPTHMELLADFETNFDRALLSVTTNNNNSNNHQQQVGGQDTSGGNSQSLLSSYDGSTTTTTNSTSTSTSLSSTPAVVDNLLLYELNESKQRIDKLEKLNTVLSEQVQQYQNLPSIDNNNLLKNYQRQIIDYKMTIQTYELEKKMLLMQNDVQTKELVHTKASINEMQLEINLLSNSNKKSHVRATAAETQLQNATNSTNNTNSNSTENVDELNKQIIALQEWAIASNESKTIAHDRIRTLEQQLLIYYQQSQQQQQQQQQEEGTTGNSTTKSDSTTLGSLMNPSVSGLSVSSGRVVVSKHGSLVVGAGDIGYRLVQIDKNSIKTILLSERVVLRWKFHLQNDTFDIIFSIIKGNGTDITSSNNINTLDDDSNNTTSSSTNEIIDEKQILSKVRSFTQNDCLIYNRTVIGGAEGETDHTFAFQHSCIVVWNNKHSWIRPKTIKYTLDAIVL